MYFTSIRDQVVLDLPGRRRTMTVKVTFWLRWTAFMKLADTERGRALPGSVVASCGDILTDK